MHKITLLPEKMGLKMWVNILFLLFAISSFYGRPIPNLATANVVGYESSYLSYTHVSILKETQQLTALEAEAFTNEGWFFECGDDKRVDEYGFNANGNTTTVGTIPDPSSVFKYAVEIVYKGGNPGSSIQVTDSNNNTRTLQRSVPFGSSSNIWVYRGMFNGSTSSVTYTNSSNTNKLQSLVVYAFRNAEGSPGSAGVFTNRSGVNDIQTITIDIPSHPVPRDLVIETPISEMTTDGRYLLLKADAEINPGEFISDQIFLYGPDDTLPEGSCCLTIPNLILPNVPGDITEITLTIDTRNKQNGQSVNGQSWVIAAGVNVDASCANDPKIALIKTGVFDDNNNDGVAQAGETISYNFTVTNTGQTDLSDITISDPLVSVNGSLAFLGAGQSNNSAFTATYSITPNDISAGFVENQALVRGCFETVPVDPNGNCEGKVTSLVLEYQGDVVDGTIKVVQHDGQTVFEGVIQPGERFEFFGQDPPQQTLGPSIDIFINNMFEQEIHTSCSEPIGPGAVFGDFEVISGTSRNNGPLQPVAGDGCVADATDLSDDNSNDQDDPTLVSLPGPEPTPRDCNCAPLYKDSNFENPTLISGQDLKEGAVYRFSNVFPSNPYGTSIDALVRVEEFVGGASLLEIDVTSSGLPEAFQPRINSTNDNEQSVLFSITFVESGGNYGDEVVLSFYGTPLDIDGDGQSTREYAEVTLPDAYFVNNNTALEITQSANFVRGKANTVVTAPGDDVSLDPRFTFSNFWDSKSAMTYRIGKIGGDSDRYYSLDISCAEYDDPNSVIITYPVICGNVSDDNGNPLANVQIDVTGSDGSSQTVFTNNQGDYKAVAEIPEALVDVTYEIRENDPPGYISISDVDGANDNLITRTIDLESSCGNDFVDGFEVVLELVSKTDIDCNGENTGSITVQASGGVPPYLYTLNGGVPQASPTFNDLPAGVYTIEVTDSLGNMDSLSVTLTQPEPLSIQFTKIDATATSGCDNGQATANVTGGVPPYQYQWSASAGNQTTATATNLPGSAGGINHTVVITDANGCTATQSVVIICVNDCDAVINVDETVNVLCKGDATGSATVSASSVANPGATFTFTWNTVPPQVDSGVTTSTINDLEAGVYTVNVTIDGTECEPVAQTVTITEPSTAVSVTATATDETGPTTGDGTATANPTGGTPPYTYSWSPGGETTQTITGLSAGTYTVTVTDANGCTAMASVTVNPGSCRDLTANATSTPVTCNGGNDGTATVSVTGGLGPFTYSWSPGGQTTQAITGLTAGAYTVTVTDTATLCTTTATTTVNEPSALSSGIAVTPVACFGDATGSLDLTVSGGTPPYSYEWSPGGQTTEDITNLTAGTYTVLITDANGCTKTDSATVTEPSEALALAITSQTDIVCASSGGATGTVTVMASGGTAPYMYSLDGGAPQASGTFENLIAGTYTISVVDGNGCDDAVSVTILENCILAIDDINDTFVNLPVDGDVSTNDINADGPAGTEVFTLVSGPANGTLNLNPDGSYTYTPNSDYVGEDTFVYQVCDGGNPIACDTATVYIEVQPLGSPGNEPPVANADTNVTQMGVPVDGNVLPNDFDPDGDPIAVTANTPPGNGSVVINPDGSYTYTPDPGFTGEDTFTYTICDNGTPALCDTATVTIQVLGNPDNITTAVDDAYYGFPDMDIAGNVLDNDTDPEGDDQTVDVAVSPSQGPSNGTVVLNADGSFTYTPNAGYTGTDSFVYEIFDDGSPVARDKATVYLSIDPNGGGNDILAIDDINDTFVNLPVDGDVSTNDINADGPAGTEVFTLVSGPANGTLNLNPDGSYTYTPNSDYVGEDTFVYQVCDGGNPIACDTATVYIEVQPLGSPGNEPPVANADTNVTQMGVPVDGNVLPNDFDPDGDPIAVTANTPPGNGSVVINPDGSYTYTPDPGFTGEDTFTYTICDNGTPALCDTATVTIQVLGNPDNITTAVDDAYYGFPDMDITGNVLDNDTDPEGDDQTVDVAVSPSQGPSNGTVVLNADGSFTYTPNAGYTGTDSFVYEIFDDGSPVARDKATVYLSIDPNGGGNDILAIDDINDTFVNLPVDGDVSTNDINADGPAGTEVFTLVSGPANGTLNLNPDGSYTYTPNSDYVGEDTFVYQVCDGGNPIACDTATVYIEVQPLGSPGNEPPVANADTNVTQMGVPVDGNVLPNDFDPDGDPIAVTANTPPGNGSVVINPDGSYTYTPDPGFTGEDTFTYTICDNGTPALCDTATVTIQVLGNPDNITTAVDDAYYGFPDMDITGNVLDNDTDPEGDDQTVDVAVSPSQGPSNGTVVLNADGSFTYTPNAGYTGTDSFVYEIFDDGSPVARDKATVYISINEPGNEILAVNDINDTFVNLPVSGDVSTNDENFDGPAGTEVFTLISGPVQGGALVFNADGTYDYTPPAGYVGDDSFEYQVCDGGNPIACDTATVTITIVDDPIIGNDPPVAINDVNITEVDIPVDGNVLVNDFDPDAGDTISVTNNTNPSNGSVVISPNGDYTYTPNPGFVGVDTFEYTICDSATPSLCDTAIVTIYIIADPGNITIANDDAYYGEVNAAITGNVLDNDSDPENNNQFVDAGTTPVEGPFNGSVVVNADGSFTYTPGTDFTGNDRFVYEIFDDGSPVARDQATVYILIEETPAPAIAIVKTGVFNDEDQDQCTNVGETITYTFEVSNQGNVPLGNITVTDPLLEAPNPVVPITFVDGDTNANNLLDIDETWTYTANYTVTQADIDAGEVVNQATVEGTDEDGTTVSDISGTTTTTDDSTTIPLCQNAAIALVKEADVMLDPNDNCYDVTVGGMIDYIFTVTNEGNVSLDNVVLTDDLLGNEAFVSGDTNGDDILQVDETWIYNGSYTITQDDIDAGQVTNTATVTADDPNDAQVSDVSGATISDDDPTVTPICQGAAIAIVKASSYDDGGDCSDPGELINYTFTVTNVGNVSLSNIVVNDPLLGGVVAGPDSGDTDGDMQLDVTETWIYTGSYAITQDDIDAGEVMNQATAEGTAPDQSVVSDDSGSTTTTDDTTITPLCTNATIAIVKTAEIVESFAGGGCPEDGDKIAYTFTVTNEGNVNLSDISVTDPLLEAPNPVVPIVFASGDTDGDTFLDPDETWIYTAEYTLTQEDVDVGEVVNQATASGLDPSGNMVSDLSHPTDVMLDEPTVIAICQAPIIALVKTGVFNDTNGNGCADPAETITYSFKVFNLGNVTLFGVDVVDPLVTVNGGPITLAPGAIDENSFTAVYTLTQADIDAGEVINQATVTGTSQLGDTVSDLSDESSEFDNDPTVTPICQGASIAIVKVSSYDPGGDCTQPGKSIDYTFTVTNTGNVSLAGVVVDDPLLGGVLAGPDSGDTDGDAELDVTETWIYTGSYVITQADIDAGQVTNRATVEGSAPDGSTVGDDSGTTATTDDATVTVLCQDPRVSLEKSGVFDDNNGDGIPQVGETISYAFTVTNTGSVTLFDLVLEDDLPGIEIMGGPIAELLPGQEDTDTFTGSYAITDRDIEQGQVVNQAIVRGLTSGGSEVNDISDDPNDPTDIDIDGDGDPDDPTVTILPNVEDAPIFEIFNGITPDGDGLNDFFNVFGIEEFGANNMKIYNRWGVLVWEADNYGGGNVFEGFSNGRATIREGKTLPTGTYFYILNFTTDDNPGEGNYTGYLYLNR